MRKLKGFTLFEIVLYMLVASIIGIVTVSFWQVIQQTGTRNQAIQNTTQHGDSAMQLMLYLVEIADSVDSPNIGNNANSLTLTVSGVSNTIQMSGDQIQITQGGNSSFLTSNDYVVTNLSFDNVGTTYDSMAINFDIEPVNPDNLGELNYTYSATGNYARFF